MLAENLRKIRQLNRLTQKQVAEAISIERSTYTRYETGDSLPTVAVLSKISRIYNVSIDYLFGNTAFPEPVFADSTGSYNAENLIYDASMSNLTKEEKEFLISFRLIRDKKAAVKILRKLAAQEKD
ncbi:MAG: helix-turn-helix domain-containing protein [Oscillospiraceae bacterium]|nr:helix-turn-helix domain-containing protein [Oscillospiraceae bacterium]